MEPFDVDDVLSKLSTQEKIDLLSGAVLPLHQCLTSMQQRNFPGQIKI